MSLYLRNQPQRLRLAVELGCVLGFALAVVLSAAAWNYRETCRLVCRDTLRLHVLANSDALSDQIQKLAVRDAILEAVSAATADATDKAEAVAAVRAALPALQAAAQQVTGARVVQMRLVEEPFAAKQYDGFRLPAGTYTALRVEIGRAEDTIGFAYSTRRSALEQAKQSTTGRKKMRWFLANMKFAAPCGIRCTRADKMIKAEPHKPGLRVRGKRCIIVTVVAAVARCAPEPM